MFNPPVSTDCNFWQKSEISQKCFVVITSFRLFDFEIENAKALKNINTYAYEQIALVNANYLTHSLLS